MNPTEPAPESDPVNVHVSPTWGRAHELIGTECWCSPKVDPIDPRSGAPYPDGAAIVIHNEPAS